MKEYKCIKIIDNTEPELNAYAQMGWKVVCRSWVRWWFVLEREKKK